GDVQAAQHIVCAAAARVAGGGATPAEHGRAEQRTGGQVAQLRRQVVAAAAVQTINMHQVLDAELLDKSLAAVTGAADTFGAPVGGIVFAPGACITFVGGDQVGGAIHLECGHGIRQIQAADTSPGIDIDDAIVIGYVSAVTV